MRGKATRYANPIFFFRSSRAKGGDWMEREARSNRMNE